MLEDPALASLPAIVLGQAGMAPRRRRHRGGAAGFALRKADDHPRPRRRARARVGARPSGLLRLRRARPRPETFSSSFGGHHAAAGVEIAERTPRGAPRAVRRGLRRGGRAGRRASAPARTPFCTRATRRRASSGTSSASSHAGNRTRPRASRSSARACSASESFAEATCASGSTSRARPLSCFGGDMGPLAAQLGSHVSARGRAPSRHLAGRGGRRDAPDRSRNRVACSTPAGRAILEPVGAGESESRRDKRPPACPASRSSASTRSRRASARRSSTPGLSLEIRRGETITVMGAFGERQERHAQDAHRPHSGRRRPDPLRRPGRRRR